MFTLKRGHALRELEHIPAGTIDCVITSPPYYSLRDYGLDPLVWGPGFCAAYLDQTPHEWGEEMSIQKSKNYNKGFNERWGNAPGQKKQEKIAIGKINQGQFCKYCGAWRGSLGLEPSVDLYIQHLREIFTQIHRVLKPGGTCWLNIGDTYCSERPGARDPERWPKQCRNDHKPAHNTYKRGVKRKELFLVPARISLALQADGWYVRQDIIWHKKNPMPESCQDRCTKAHEYIFLLTKQLRYYFDLKAIKEPQEEYERQRRLREKAQGLNTRYTLARDGQTGLADQSQQGACRSAVRRQELAIDGTRHPRSVWTTSAGRFNGAHFATFPEALVERMMKAGCPPGGTVLDPFCGAGTTGAVATRLGRDFIGFDLNADYLLIAKERIECRTATR